MLTRTRAILQRIRRMRSKTAAPQYIGATDITVFLEEFNGEVTWTRRVRITLPLERPTWPDIGWSFILAPSTLRWRGKTWEARGRLRVVSIAERDGEMCLTCEGEPDFAVTEVDPMSVAIRERVREIRLERPAP